MGSCSCIAFAKQPGNLFASLLTCSLVCLFGCCCLLLLAASRCGACVLWCMLLLRVRLPSCAANFCIWTVFTRHPPRPSPFTSMTLLAAAFGCAHVLASQLYIRIDAALWVRPACILPHWSVLTAACTQGLVLSWGFAALCMLSVLCQFRRVRCWCLTHSLSLAADLTHPVSPSGCCSPYCCALYWAALGLARPRRFLRCASRARATCLRTLLTPVATCVRSSWVLVLMHRCRTGLFT